MKIPSQDQQTEDWCHASAEALELAAKALREKDFPATANALQRALASLSPGSRDLEGLGLALLEGMRPDTRGTVLAHFTAAEQNAKSVEGSETAAKSVSQKFNVPLLTVEDYQITLMRRAWCFQMLLTPRAMNCLDALFKMFSEPGDCEELILDVAVCSLLLRNDPEHPALEGFGTEVPSTQS